jgi:CheY-like chemotaxis protein
MSQPKEQQESYQGNFGSMNGLSMKRKSLLVVDDEPTILHALSRDLECTGAKVTTAASGEEAIAKINNNYFDLVKTAKQKNLQTMVIILTGYGAMESAVDALRLGADDFLQKPCDTEELLYRISNCLMKQELQRKLTWYENLLPVCCYCKKIREDRKGMHGQGNWYSLENYFSKTKGVNVSHGCCPDCYAEQRKNFLGKGEQAESENR